MGVNKCSVHSFRRPYMVARGDCQRDFYKQLKGTWQRGSLEEEEAFKGIDAL